jgi:hypothetical protein
MERSRREREDREKPARENERRNDRGRSRENAKDVARDGEIKFGRATNASDLPWMHKNIIREQIDPYRDWSAKQKQVREAERDAQAKEKPYQDRIEAAGKDWSKDNSLEELRGLNKYLWDNIEDRIPKEDYKKLSGWIRDKERERKAVEPEKKIENEKELEIGEEKNSSSNGSGAVGGQGPGGGSADKHKDRGSDETVEGFTYKGEKYTKTESYGKLTELAEQKREDEEKVPFDDYQKLRTWIEDADRARFAGAIEKQLELTHKKVERSKTMEDLKAAEGGRVLEPALEDAMRNPFFGLYMKIAGLSNELVRSIPLDDRLRDPLKEGRDDLEAGKKGIDQRGLERMSTPTSEMSPEQLQSLKGAEKKDRDNRERIEQDIEKNKVAKHEELKKQKEDRDKREPEYDTFDPWGMY